MNPKLLLISSVFVMGIYALPMDTYGQVGCVRCSVDQGTGYHEAVDDDGWNPHELGGGTHKFVNAGCEDQGHEHFDGCGSIERLTDLWEVMASNELVKVKDFFAQGNGLLRLNTQRHSLQLLSCDGKSYLRDFGLNERELALLVSAME